MRRILLVAADRALTRFIAESLLGRSIDTPPKGDDEWDIARAHSPVEAEVLVRHGLRPFDLIVVDHDLGGADALELLDTLREAHARKEVPLFLLTERGRDPHVRRVAVERHQVTGFIEKPVTAERLREQVGTLERSRRILLVEPDEDLAERYAASLTRAGYVVDRVGTGREALDRAPRFRPDAALLSLVLPDLQGLEVCVALKRAQRTESLPVVLYGQVSALGQQRSEENAFRADDFVQAPFDDDVLVERVALLVGVGPGGKLRRRRRSVLDRLPPAELDAEHPTLSEIPRFDAEEDEDATGRGASNGVPAAAAPSGPSGSSGPPTLEGPSDDLEGEDDTLPPSIPSTSTPPPSASPAAVSPTRRTTRRVPCNTAMSVRNGAKVYRSRTLDISHGGIFLATEEPLEIGERIDMAFKIPGGDTTIRAVGKVCWIGKGGAEQVEGVGVKFSRIEPSDLEQIVNYVNRIARVLYSASE